MKILLGFIGVLAGGWMIVDGVHVMLRGKYIGPQKPGPWSVPFVKLGVDPFRLGPMFVGLGTLWLIFLTATLAGKPWGRYAAVATAVASLWYLPLGTILSLVYIALLCFTRA